MVSSCNFTRFTLCSNYWQTHSGNVRFLERKCRMCLLVTWATKHCKSVQYIVQWPKYVGLDWGGFNGGCGWPKQCHIKCVNYRGFSSSSFTQHNLPSLAIYCLCKNPIIPLPAIKINGELAWFLQYATKYCQSCQRTFAKFPSALAVG